MIFHGFYKSTLLDYPKHLAATVFTGGCNMRCPFCHNASLVLCPQTQPVISEEEILAYLRKRKNILEGVCISGGEPTLYADLPSFISKVKEIGLKVKLDTNGTNPAIIKHLMENDMIDYIAMDIKNSPEKYTLTAGFTALTMEDINESISLIISGKADYEFRTTVVSELHTENDIETIGKWVRGAKAYYLQSYKDSGDIISPGFTSPDKHTLERFRDILLSYVEFADIRGVD